MNKPYRFQYYSYFCKVICLLIILFSIGMSAGKSQTLSQCQSNIIAYENDAQFSPSSLRDISYFNCQEISTNIVDAKVDKYKKNSPNQNEVNLLYSDINDFLIYTSSNNAELPKFLISTIVITGPHDVYACIGGSAQFIINVSGENSPYKYNWFINGIFSDSTTEPILNIPLVTAIMDSNKISCIIVDNSGSALSAVSDTAMLYAVNPSAIIQQPENDTLCEGDDAVFSVITNSPVATYLWQISINGGVSWSNLEDVYPYSGTHTNQLHIDSSTTAINFARFCCIVNTPCGILNSSYASLRVINCQISANAIPNQKICFEGCLYFGAFPTGGMPEYSYEWSPSDYFPHPFERYQPNPYACFSGPDTVMFFVKVTDLIGNIDIDTLIIIVDSEIFANAGADDTISPGDIVHLNATVSGGNAPYTFNWGGLTDSAILVMPTQTTDYCVTITDILGCSDSDGLTLFLDGTTEFANLGGTVFGGQYPLDIINATLIANNEDELLIIDRATFDTLGYYYFINLISGNYLIKAEPAQQSAYNYTYVPTYYGDVLHWQDALLINLEDNIFQSDINLISAVGYDQGFGTIAGAVVNGEFGGKDDKYPVSGVEILLKNAGGNTLAYINTDQWGQFSFSEIAFGTYQIYPEIEGKNTTPYWVTLNASNPKVTVWISVYDDEVVAGNADFLNYSESGFSDLYPVPAREQVNIYLSAADNISFWVDITDLTGKIVIPSRDYFLNVPNTLSFDLEGLVAGTYLMRIIIKDGSVITRKFVKVW